jgi:hypothetical protein
MNRNRTLPFTWIEIAITIAILLIIARYYWARELLEFEKTFFSSLGLNENLKYIITVPVALLCYFSLFKREKEKANSQGKPIVSKYVLLFAGFSILGVILYLTIWVQRGL